MKNYASIIKKITLSLLFLFLTGCAGVKVPYFSPATLEDVIPGSDKIVVSKIPPDSGSVNKGSIVASHGSGCGFGGFEGNWDGAIIAIKNKAVQMEADYVHILIEKAPYSDGKCAHNEYRIEGNAYDTSVNQGEEPSIIVESDPVQAFMSPKVTAAKELTSFRSDKGTLAKGETKSFSFEGEQNSPLVIFTPEPKDGLQYHLEILDKRDKQLYQFNYIGRYKSNDYEHAFTPPDSGTYTLRLTGTAHHGKFNFSMEQIAVNSDLRGKGNVVSLGERLNGKLAIGAVAEYSFEGEQNSPLVIFTPEPKDGLQYHLEILDKRDKQLYQFNYIGRYKSNDYEHAFTPPDSGTYTLRLTGTAHHGKFKFSFFRKQ